MAYYRRRAGEYDATAYDDVAVAAGRVERLVKQMRPTGAVLEIACGTGMWTAALARWASTLVAVDAAPETIQIARERVALPNVTFEVADAFSWTTSERFDVIFFSAWLSHVPMSRFEQFWAFYGPCWRTGGGCCSSTSTPTNAGRSHTFPVTERPSNERCATAASFAS